jgi:hypothetical protein
MVKPGWSLPFFNGGSGNRHDLASVRPEKIRLIGHDPDFDSLELGRWEAAQREYRKQCFISVRTLAVGEKNQAILLPIVHG